MVASLERDGDQARGAWPRGQRTNLRPFQTLLRAVQKEHGEAALGRVAAAAGIEPTDLLRQTVWVTHDQVESLLSAARALYDHDEAFLDACAYQLRESLGPLVVVLRVLSVQRAYEIAAATVHLHCEYNRAEVVNSRPGHVRLRYFSTHHESRLACLTRHPFLTRLPTFWWGLPPATLREHACISRGDPCCEYELRWQEPLRLNRLVLATAAGVAAAALSLTVGWVSPLAAALIAGAGAATGVILEQRRVNRELLRLHHDTARAAERLGNEHNELSKEIMALLTDQRGWNNLLEQRLTERSAMLNQVVEGLQKLNLERSVTLGSLSHDLRNPLTVVEATVDMLRGDPRLHDPELRADLDEIWAANQQLQHLTRELLKLARSSYDLFATHPEEVQLEPLVDRVRRCLMVLVNGRPIRASVFRSREAPERVLTDNMLVNRILDNLVSNAAKYTERGSIVVEFSGTPGFLCVKISDTGRGISDEEIERVFAGRGGSDPPPFIGTSEGLGLSTVVLLLDRLGGRLEIMSRPEQGTTLWLYVPVEPPARTTSSATVTPLDLARRVLTVRHSEPQSKQRP